MTSSASGQSRRARGNGQDSSGSLLALSKKLFGREARYWQQRLLGELYGRSQTRIAAYSSLPVVVADRLAYPGLDCKLWAVKSNSLPL